MVLLRPYLAVLLMLLVFGKAYALSIVGDNTISLNAFGTLGAAWLSNDHVNYQQGSQRVGPGLTHDIDLGLDSRLGAQLSIAVTPTTLITGQAVVERLANNEFMPRLTQANIRQEIGDGFFIRLGRIQSPIFLASDYRLANFSNPWARTPGVVYNVYPITHLDSAEFSYSFDSGFGRFRLNAGYGWMTYPYTPNEPGFETTELELDDTFYANLTFDNGPWRFKVSWMHALLSSHFSGFDQTLRFVSLVDPAAATELRLDQQGESVWAAGFAYDAPDWLVMAEWGIAYGDRPVAFNDKHGGYLTVGYHFGRWMPQMTIGYQGTTDRRVHSVNPIVDQTLDYSHRFQRSDYRTLALGLNYAATDSVMIRGQVDLIEPMRNSKGPYLITDSQYKSDDPGVDVLFSLSVDFVY